LGPSHGESFACARLSVTQNTSWVPVQCAC
jgi:hypothetical protein